MSFKCPICWRALSCNDTRPVTAITTLKHYWCEHCELIFQSFETLDKEGRKKRSYVKSGKYRGVEAKYKRTRLSNQLQVVDK